MARRPLRPLLAATLLALGACHRAEPPEVVRARSRQQFLLKQVAGLHELVAKAERGELVTLDQIAIGINEQVARDLMNAPLPRDITIEKRLLIRIDGVEPLFRGNRAAVVFRARASSLAAPAAFAAIELGGTLDNFQLTAGTLSARVKVGHFVLLDSSVGSLGRGLVETLVRNNLGTIEQAIPPVEIPVHIDEAVRIGGGTMGPVTVLPGELPLEIGVAQVIPVGQRLWVMLDAKAGPWKVGEPEP